MRAVVGSMGRAARGGAWGGAARWTGLGRFRRLRIMAGPESRPRLTRSGNRVCEALHMMNLQGKIRSLLVLEPRHGDYDALISVFREHDVLGKAIRLAGAPSAEVHLPLERNGAVVGTAVWDSADCYAG